MITQHATVKELSPHVRRALASVGYGAADVPIVAAESVDSGEAGGAGMRGFVLILNLDDGRYETVNGSWGGATIADPRNPVDRSEMIPVPPNGAVIKGTRGYPRTFATIYAHPQAMGRFLPSGEAEQLTDAEQAAIYCHAAIKGGEYRRDELRRRGVQAETIDSLVTRGYLKRNRAGAVQITTKGKNARTIRH